MLDLSLDHYPTTPTQQKRLEAIKQKLEQLKQRASGDALHEINSLLLTHELVIKNARGKRNTRYITKGAETEPVQLIDNLDDFTFRKVLSNTVSKFAKTNTTLETAKNKVCAKGALTINKRYITLVELCHYLEGYADAISLQKLANNGLLGTGYNSKGQTVYEVSAINRLLSGNGETPFFSEGVPLVDVLAQHPGSVQLIA